MNCLRLFVIVLFTASNPVGFAQDLTLSELDAPSIQRQAALEEIESTLVSNEIDYYPELDQIPLPSPIDTFDDGEVDPLLEPSAVGPIAQGTSETPTILEPVTNQEIGDPQETDVIADGAVTDHEQPLAVKFDILLFDNLTITSNETEVIDAVDIDIPSESTPNATGDSNPTEDNQPHENDLETVEETPVTDTPVAETTAVEVAADTEDQPANQTQDVDGEQQTTDLSEETTQDNNGSEISTIETPEVRAPLNSQEVGESQEANIITDEIVAANQPSFEDTSATDQQNVDTDDQRQISQKTIRTSNPEKVKEILEKFQVFLKKIRNRQAYQLLD